MVPQLATIQLEAVAASGAMSYFPVDVSVAVVGMLLGLVLGALISKRKESDKFAREIAHLRSLFQDLAPTDSVIPLEQIASHTTLKVEATHAESSRLRQALDVLPQGVVIQDEHGEVVFRNACASALIGSRHSDLLAARAVEDQLKSTSHTEPGERILELYGPPRRTLVVRTEPLQDGDRFIGVVAVLEDVSERRRLEAIRRDFVANVSHELKTPVAALALLAETILDENDPEVTQRLAARTQFEAVRVGRIIDDLLDLSRLEAEEAPPREPVSVSLILGEAIERVRSAAEKQSIELRVADSKADLSILGDRRQLVSAIHNLLENAIKYSDEGSCVQLEAHSDGHWINISVGDSGIGIPVRDLGRIFERFYRVDQARSRSSGGTGLGLAIVRHVAANHGGTVQVDSREGEGSTFTLRLPNSGTDQ